MAVIVSKQIGKIASDYEVDDIVKIPVNGVNMEFSVVHQDKPSSDYDNSRNGTWL